jgi:NAD(P)-dependent dehydrogenase (short-subunit alcohol dehydrogenase family)
MICWRPAPVLRECDALTTHLAQPADNQNAGLNVPAIPMEDLTVAQFRSLMDVNVTACFVCAQEAIRIMKAQEPKGGRWVHESCDEPGARGTPGFGVGLAQQCLHGPRSKRALCILPTWSRVQRSHIRIINNGSISAYTPRVFSAPYTMSKHAILGLTKSLALDGREHNIACSQLDVGEWARGSAQQAGQVQRRGVGSLTRAPTRHRAFA